MKVGIVSLVDKDGMPYLKYYEDILKDNKIDYQSIFWDRFNEGEIEKDNNEYTIHMKCLPGEKKLKKIIPMFKYKKILETIIKKEKYSHLIVLTTFTGILLYKTLLNNYANKYIFDIRDYSYEKYNIYKKMVNKLISESFFTSISSLGFMKFLNDYNNKIIVCHNIVKFNEKIVNNNLNKQQITIGYVGGVRYYNANCKLIKALANSKKYKLLYVGKINEDCDLIGYCKDNNIKNVEFRGKYKNKDKIKFYTTIDLINSVYGNDSLEVSTLLPNRLYDAIILRKPIIVSKGTYLSEIVEKYNLGLSVSFDDNISKKIEKYIINFDQVKFNNACSKFLKKAEKEQKYFINNIQRFVETYKGEVN